MATLGELRSRLLRLLGDPEGSGYSDALLIDAISNAFDAILPWMPKTSKHTLTGDGTAVSFALPSDYYDAEALLSEEGEALPKAYLTTGQFLGERSNNANDWIEYPNGYLSLSNPISSGAEYTLYYLARWAKPTVNTEEAANMEPPEIATIGISLYSAAYALLPAAIGAAEVRQFNTRIDSGTPEHNPIQRTALYLLDLFKLEMSRHPKHQKAAK
jgi:hypothetical protein